MLLSVDVLNSLVLFALKATCALLVVRWLVEQSRDLSAAAARSLLALSAVIVLLIPLLMLILPALPVAVVPELLAQWLEVPVVAQSGDTLNYNGLFLAMVSLYLLIAAWLAFYTVIGVVQVAGISGRGYLCDNNLPAQRMNLMLSQQLQLPRSPLVKISREIASPQVWGWRRPVVLLPPSCHQWPESRLRRVMIHELAHIKRHDWPIKMMLRMASTLLWFIPFIWMTARRSAWYAELACDDWVVRIEGGRAEYADDLLQLTTDGHVEPAAVGALSLAAGPSLYFRIRAVLDGTRNRAPATLAERVKYMVLTTLFLLPLASVQAVIHPASKVADFLSKPHRLIIVAPAPAGSPASASSGLSIFSRSELASLRQVPEAPPAIEEVITVEQLTDDAPAARPSRRSSIPVLAMVMDPSIAMRGPQRLVTVVPQYPRRALARGIEGSVVVAFDVGTNGGVINPRIVRAEPHAIFNRAVLDAVSQFRFRPPEVNGQAIITKNITETFVFQLMNGITGNQPKPDRQSAKPGTYAANASPRPRADVMQEK